MIILIPVLGRPHQIKPVLASIKKATKVEHRVVFICSPNDPTTAVCRKTKATTIVVPWEPERADFAKKINHAYVTLRDEDEWFFQGATDLAFHPGWAEAALHVGETERVGVVGTNDLGNPRVRSGSQATHILFSRSYIEDYGGTFDDTGAVFSEQYDHQFVDTEFVQVASMRGQFRPCLLSIVEHLHPHWGKGVEDATYEKGQRAFREDHAIYAERMKRARASLQGRRR